MLLFFYHLICVSEIMYQFCWIHLFIGKYTLKLRQRRLLAGVTSFTATASFQSHFNLIPVKKNKKKTNCFKNNHRNSTAYLICKHSNDAVLWYWYTCSCWRGRWRWWQQSTLRSAMKLLARSSSRSLKHLLHWFKIVKITWVSNLSTCKH